MTVLNLTKKRKQNNHGFSLIEVLLAIVLLGLIAAPILQMFYSSMAMNLRSKKYLAAAELAQTTMEAISAQTWEDSVPIAEGASSVSGLNTYYNGATKTGNKKLYIVTNGINNGPNAYVPSHTISGSHISIPFRNINYDGYKFHVLMEFDTTNSTNKYYTVPVKISIYDADSSEEDFGTASYSKFALLQTASTNVPNKR